MTDWKKILKAYIAVVGEAEGIDFLPHELPTLSKEEKKALYEVAMSQRICDQDELIDDLKSGEVSG